MRIPAIRPIGPAKWLLFVILLMAAILRFYGIHFGAPLPYHPDEVKLVTQAGHLLNTHFMDKEVYFMSGLYPILFTLALAVLMGFYIMAAMLTGRLEGIQNAAEFYQQHTFDFFLIGRYFVAILGILSVYILYLLVKRLFKSERLSLVSAALLAVNFIHVRNSHFCTVDVPAAFLALCSIYYSARVLEKPEKRYYFLSALFAAAAIGAKYSLFFVVLPLAYAHTWHAWQNRPFFKSLFNHKAWLALGTLIVGFLVFVPMFVMDFQYSLQRMVRLQTFEKVGKIGSGGGLFSYWTGDQPPGFGLFYPNSIPTTFGALLTVLILVGIGYQLYRHKKQDILLLIFMLPMYFYFEHLSYKAMRHIIPIIPIMLVSSAIIIDEISNRLFNNAVLRMSALTGLVLGLVISGASSSWNYLDEIRKKDPRTSAAEWVVENVPRGSNLLVESFPPYLPDLFNQDDPDREYNITRARLQYKYPALADSFITEMKAGHYDYYIADGFTRQLFSWKYTQKKYPEITKDRNRLFQWLDSELPVAVEFRPEHEIIQPFVMIYAVKEK